MKKRLSILSVFIVLAFSLSELSCYSKYSKKNHLNTIKVGNQLFYEIYKISSGGTLASDTYSYYLTDSINFRKYLGTIYYDDEHLYCKEIDSDRTIVYRAYRNIEGDTIEKTIYCLSDLKSEGKFD